MGCQTTYSLRSCAMPGARAAQSTPIRRPGAAGAPITRSACAARLATCGKPAACEHRGTERRTTARACGAIPVSRVRRKARSVRRAGWRRRSGQANRVRPARPAKCAKPACFRRQSSADHLRGSIRSPELDGDTISDYSQRNEIDRSSAGAQLQPNRGRTSRRP